MKGTLAGLAPKTVRNVDVMQRRALRDAVKCRYIPRSVAEDGEPPARRGQKRKVWTPGRRARPPPAAALRASSRRPHVLPGVLLAGRTPLHPQTITDQFFRLSRAAGLPLIRLHDVRHSHATAALPTGVHPKIVSERLGHASVAFTRQARPES